MENFYHIKENIKILKEVDVAIIGGGPSGTFAAISASRQGAKTLLVEKTGRLGGTTTNAYVNFPGLFHAWGKQIINGPCWEAIERTTKLDNVKLPDFSSVPPAHWQHQIRVNIYTYSTVLDEMCEESKVELLFHTMISYAEERDDGIYLVFTSKEGMWAVKANYVIDTTGDLNVVGMMKYERIKSDELQPGSLMNTLDGYDIQNIDEEIFNEFVRTSIEEGVILKEDIQGGNLYRQISNYQILMHITNVDGSTSQGRTTAEKAGRKKLMLLVHFLRSYPGLENLYVKHAGEETGIRETYRVVGEDTITVEKYGEGYMYDDAVCYSFYPIDLHIPEGIKIIKLKENTFPTIPYGALIPKGSKRLLVAGRSISGDQDANSAYRVQASSMATGQVAGVAAALATQEGLDVKDVSISQLRKKLKEIGAIIPEKEINLADSR
ncbi:FAD-dependent oxidoreductase [Jeotgalibaca caeni]|uniref:FAD-dependent oxidoreductase n=1 Tax=Jeotgalibaca caeni TaxID=3028623 RepID=UPI00237D5A58|nr:FAD-dependent oxidoreductase [Jeotgalibaca caeni]MDE1549992.1 FAD-dependent oxidoreductase [Jeotgalibaca caeni]